METESTENLPQKRNILPYIAITLICTVYGTIWCQEKYQIWKHEIAVQELAKGEYISFQACALKGMPEKLSKR